MLKNFSGFIALVPLFFLTCAGCDRPEIPRSEYGKMVDEYPDFPNAPKTLPLPEGVISEESSSGRMQSE